MYSVQAFILSILIARTYCGLRLPDWFKLGAGSSAIQIEGGWNASDKGMSTIDKYLHDHPDQASADVAADSYHLWRRDVEMAAELGLDVYRFSISWTRLLPSGFSNHISEDGKRYYNDLIDGLLEKGIEPVVTIYHFDLPQSLQDLGGWANPLISDWFADYARVVYSLFGDRVKTWLTINEPYVICDLGYTTIGHPPYLFDLTGLYLCSKNVILAHAKAYRVYEKEFKPLYNGKLSIVNLFIWMQPETPEERDVTELVIEYVVLRFVHPIFSEGGGWPEALEAFLLEKSERDGQPTQRLPPFTAEETEMIRGTYDFFALNHYTSRLVRKARPDETVGYGGTIEGVEALRVIMTNDPSWGKSDAPWFAVNPVGLRKVLNFLNNKYDVKEILITENGYLSRNSSLADYRTVSYTKDYLEQAILAIRDGVNVTGYINWALMDTYEGGYESKYGLYSVDFEDENRTRTIKESGRYFARVSKTRCTDPNECQEIITHL